MTNEQAPATQNCPDCDGMGVTSDRVYLERIVSLIMLAGADGTTKNGQRRHPYFEDLTRLIGVPKANPTYELSELSAGLSGRKPDPIWGHDSLDQHRAVAAIIKAAGLPENWAYCRTCHGSGLVPKLPSPTSGHA